MPRPTTLPEPWRTLADKLGGVSALADALGTGPRTVNNWATGGRSPRGTARIAITALFRRHRIEPPVFTQRRR